MVREGYGTSGDNGATVGANALKGDRAEVLPLLARDHNLSSVPGSDVENGPRASDAGSGNDGRAPKNGRGRGALHGEVLLATKTVQKKKPYKSLGWSLIAVRPDPDPLADADEKKSETPPASPGNPRARRPNTPTPRARAHPTSPPAPNAREHPRTPARPSPNTSPSTFLDPPAQAAASGILVACMVAAAVAPFSTVGPGRPVDRETAVMMREHMGSDDADPFADANAVRLAPLTPGRFARAARVASPVDGAWPAKLVVVPAVFDEWDVPEGESVESSVPAWARPDPVKDPYVVSDLYQRRFEAAPGFVPNRAYETAVYLKFIVDNYENLPDVTAFVRGDFHRDVADAKQRLVRVANRAAGVAYQPLDIPETTKDDVVALGLVESRSPGELVQMWKDESWGWEGIMGDTAGAAAAHVSRCWRGLVDEFGEFTVDKKEEDETRKPSPETRTAAAAAGAREARALARARSAREATQTQTRRQSELGQFFYPTSGGGGATSGGTRGATSEDRRATLPAYPVVSEEDKAELAKPPVTISAYGGDNFAVSRERLTRVPLKTWKKLYDRLVTRGECLAEGAETTGRDEIRDKFDLGVGLEHLAHVIFGGMPADAGEAARCCGATCVLRDATCDIADEDEKDGASDDASDAARRRLASHMEAIEAKIARHNGWDLVGLRAERAAMDEADASDSASDSSSDKVSDSASDVDYPIAAVGAAREEGPTRGDAGWRKILDGEKAKISAGELEPHDAAADAVAKKKLEIMLDDALREADRLREQVRQLDGRGRIRGRLRGCLRGRLRGGASLRQRASRRRVRKHPLRREIHLRRAGTREARAQRVHRHAQARRRRDEASARGETRRARGGREAEEGGG